MCRSWLPKSQNWSAALLSLLQWRPSGPCSEAEVGLDVLHVQGSHAAEAMECMLAQSSLRFATRSRGARSEAAAALHIACICSRPPPVLPCRVSGHKRGAGRTIAQKNLLSNDLLKTFSMGTCGALSNCSRLSNTQVRQWPVWSLQDCK